MGENLSRAKELVSILRQAFPNVRMPEESLPLGIERDSAAYRLFLTLTVAIDYKRDADELWNLARKAFETPETRYLFDPEAVVSKGTDNLKKDLRKTGLLKNKDDLHIWLTLCRTFSQKKIASDPLNLLQLCDMDAGILLDRMAREGRDFPFLKGPKISALWIRMLRDNAGLSIRNLEAVPIPVDIHVMKATFCSGALTGPMGDEDSDKRQVAALWKKAVVGETISSQNGIRPMVSLDLDMALWTLGRDFCNQRKYGSGSPSRSCCPASPGCGLGRFD